MSFGNNDEPIDCCNQQPTASRYLCKAYYNYNVEYTTPQLEAKEEACLKTLVSSLSSPKLKAQLKSWPRRETCFYALPSACPDLHDAYNAEQQNPYGYNGKASKIYGSVVSSCAKSA